MYLSHCCPICIMWRAGSEPFATAAVLLTLPVRVPAVSAGAGLGEARTCKDGWHRPGICVNLAACSTMTDAIRSKPDSDDIARIKASICSRTVSRWRRPAVCARLTVSHTCLLYWHNGLVPSSRLSQQASFGVRLNRGLREAAGD